LFTFLTILSTLGLAFFAMGTSPCRRMLGKYYGVSGQLPHARDRARATAGFEALFFQKYFVNAPEFF